MNGFAFLLMMLSQMNPEDLVMQLKEPLKNDQRKDFKEKNLSTEAQILKCRLLKMVFSELEEEISNEK